MSIKSTFGANLVCSICQLSEIDDVNFGQIHCKKEFSVHLFCLYFSTNLPQRARDTSGILGFEFRDIRNLIKNSIQSQCCYCHKKSATTYCQAPDCDRVYHQICGFHANARFEYLDHFKTYCDLHNQIEEPAYPGENYGCWICRDALGNYHPVQTVPACPSPNCRNKWFHQQCLRNYALNAGYAFTCPLCRNKSYGDIARRHGIYVPEYEALWEKTNDYHDIERFYSRCDSKNCLCPNGRLFTDQKWIIKLCSCCGSYGLHELCRPENERMNEVFCDLCWNIANNSHTTNNHGDASHNNIVDLTADSPTRISRPEAASGTCNHADGSRMIDDLNNNMFEENIRSDADITETLEEKRLREKAERPVRDEMRQFRISLLFR